MQPIFLFCVLVSSQCRCYDKTDLLPPENPVHCQYSNRLQRKIDIQCCLDKDFCNKHFQFNPELFDDQVTNNGKHFGHIFLIDSFFLFFFSFLSLLALYIPLYILYFIFNFVWKPMFDLRCMVKNILFPTDSPSWCNKSNTDMNIHSCCNDYDYCNLDLRLKFPEAQGGLCHVVHKDRCMFSHEYCPF